MADPQLGEVAGAMRDKVYGKYRGVVTDNRDPTRRGRLKVRVPAVMGEQEVWAMPCAPYAGSEVGLFALPEIDTGVWVEFEGGDPSYPIWAGCFWGDGQIPSSDAGPEVKFLRTRKVTIRIDDDSGELLIETEGGSRLRLTAQEVVVEGTTVTQQSGTKKTALTAASFDVHDGAFTVV